MAKECLMLLRFRVRNFLSMRDEQELSFVASSLKDSLSPVHNVGTVTKYDILSAAVIYGANASGKSNIITAMRHFQSDVRNSHSQRSANAKINRREFALDSESIAESTMFEMDFLSEGVRYTYGFEVDQDQYVSEWLYGFPKGVVSIFFERDFQEFKFGRSLKGRNKTISEFTRKNSLFLSTAAQNDHDQLSKISEFISKIRIQSNISVSSEAATMSLGKKELDQRAVEFLTSIGTGVCGFKTEEEKLPDEAKALTSALFKVFSDAMEDMPDIDPAEFPETRTNIKLGHLSREGDLKYFDLNNESAGTRRLLVLLGPIFDVLDEGGLLVIDEIDASLHTKACELIVSLFNNKERNPKGAQLIATTHDTNLLMSDMIRRDQVWFTEKDMTGATSLYPLSDISTRKGDNLERGYLQGRFGGVPFSGTAIKMLGKNLAS